MSRKIGPINKVERLESVTNEVYKIRNNNEYILKIYSNKGPYLDTDLKIIKSFGNLNGTMRKIYLSGRNEGVNFAVLEYIKGKMLSDVVYKKNSSEYCKELFNFFKFCSKIRIKKYGRINNSLNGTYKNWTSFVLDLEKRIYERSANFYKLVGIDLQELKSLTNKLLKHRKISSALIPADVNLSNFIIAKNEKLRAIEIGSWFSGDYLLPYGVLLTHIWKTPLHDYILTNNLIKKNIRIVLLYSLLESLSVISFNKRQYPHKLKTLKPFGNKELFINILNEQKTMLGI